MWYNENCYTATQSDINIYVENMENHRMLDGTR